MTKSGAEPPAYDRAQLEAVIQAMADGVVVFDMAGNVVLLNEAEARICGFSSAAEMTRDLAFFASIYRLFTADGCPLAVDDWPVSRVLRGETLANCHLRARRIDIGRDWHIEFSGAPVRDAAGRQVLAVVITRDVTDRVRAEEALRASEERYRTVFESMDEGFCLIQLIFDERDQPIDYRFLETNTAFERHSGLRDAVGRTARELVPDLDAAWFTIYGRVALTGEAIRFENHSPAMGRWFDVYACRTGEPARRQVALLFTDISERKRAEQARLESEARTLAAASSAEAERRLLDAVLEAAPVGIIVADAGGRLVRMNPANERLWGIAPYSENVAGYQAWKGWWADGSERQGRLIGPDEWAMARALRGEPARGDIVTIEPFDAPGTRRTMLNSGAPVRDAEGKVVGAVIAQMNITDLVEAQNALRESQARFRALADNMSQLAWIADEKGWIGWYNQRWFEYTGTTLEEMQGWGWQKVHHPDHVEQVTAKFRRHVETGEAWEDTFPLRGKDGQFRWFLSRAIPIRDESGKVVRWFGTNTDITAQREAEETLRQAVRLRDDFLSIAAHELRTPLTALSLQLEGLKRLVARGAAGGERVAHKLETAIRQGERLGSLIDGLLNVSRIVSGRFRLELERFDLAELVRENVERMSDMAARSECELRFTPPGPVIGLWDRSRVDQVVMNLLTNAIKYGPGQPVEVALVPGEDHVELRVRDLGIGIPEEDQARIFGRFERAVPLNHYGGLGLGLYITREIVQAHGGSVEVRSAPGQGATFLVRLPLVTREQPER